MPGRLSSGGRLQETRTGRIPHACDFDEALQTAREGDLVYLDPPYTVADEYNAVVKYTFQVLSGRDQERLAKPAQRRAPAGCHVVISKAHPPSIRELRQRFKFHRIDRPSRVAANPEKRRMASEYVLTSCQA